MHVDAPAFYPVLGFPWAVMVVYQSYCIVKWWGKRQAVKGQPDNVTVASDRERAIQEVFAKIESFRMTTGKSNHLVLDASPQREQIGKE